MHASNHRRAAHSSVKRKLRLPSQPNRTAILSTMNRLNTTSNANPCSLDQVNHSKSNDTQSPCESLQLSPRLSQPRRLTVHPNRHLLHLQTDSWWLCVDHAFSTRCQRHLCNSGSKRNFNRTVTEKHIAKQTRQWNTSSKITLSLSTPSFPLADTKFPFYNFNTLKHQTYPASHPDRTAILTNTKT